MYAQPVWRFTVFLATGQLDSPGGRLDARDVRGDYLI